MWASVDYAWEQEKLEARKMLENAAESHTSGAPKKIAGDHFIREDEDPRPENALLGVLKPHHWSNSVATSSKGKVSTLVRNLFQRETRSFGWKGNSSK